MVSPTARELQSAFSSPMRHDQPSTAETTTTATDLVSPFPKLNVLDRDDLRETAYEIFFTACRSEPGFGGRNALTYYSSSENVDGLGNSSGSSGVRMAVTSRVKRGLGLKMLARPASGKFSSSPGANLSSPIGRGGEHPFNPGSSPNTSLTVPQQRSSSRALNAAEIMRQQMKVTEQSNRRLRKTLMRALVGQTGRRAETIILPLELLHNLKPLEFSDSQEYRLWQQRQLKILEAGLFLNPSIPLEKSNTSIIKLREIIQASEIKAIDTGKNSETMRTLCECVISLAWRSHDGSPNDACHWADGFPLNVHIYNALLHSIFDIKDETLILDEVDELLELMKKTWSTLGINRSIHNLCFTWVLFKQYIATGQVEIDLLAASNAMLFEVANDAKKADREPIYAKMLGSVLAAMKCWSEKRLLDYHGCFDTNNVGLMEIILPLAFTSTKILEEDDPASATVAKEKGELLSNSTWDRVDVYIRASLKNALSKVLEAGNFNDTCIDEEEASKALHNLANELEELALKEREVFSPVLKKWQPVAAGVAAATLHSYYGTLLQQYLAGISSSLSNETIEVLDRAGKLEKFMIQMVVEESAECEDGGKKIVTEMVPYEVDSVIVRLFKQCIKNRLKKGEEVLNRAKETETWNPKSKTEPYAQSAVELARVVTEAMEENFEIPSEFSEDLVLDLVNGIEHLFQEYTAFVALCGSKQNYIPALPPLTRCNRDSSLSKLWKKTACTSGVEAHYDFGSIEGNSTRHSTTRGTQRLYIRVNTLHYILSQLHALEKTISLSPRVNAATRKRLNCSRQLGSPSSYFEHIRTAILEASEHISEIAAYRLVFLDSNSVLYGNLYACGVENARILPAAKILKQNLTLLCAILTDRGQTFALKEVMKASLEAYLMVLLAGGPSRIFSGSDHQMIEEDFEELKKVFFTCGEGLITEDVVHKEAEATEGVVALMGKSTGQLIEDFGIVACEASGMGMVAEGQKLPMPPTTGKWSRTDPNTILRILCHRNDQVANQFLKRTFHLARRR